MIVDDLVFVCRRDPVRLAVLDEFITTRDTSKAKRSHSKDTSNIAGNEAQEGTRKAWRWSLLASLNDMTPESPLVIHDKVLLETVTNPKRKAELDAKTMTKAEGKEHQESKKLSSFTQKKLKRFREW